MNMPINNNFEEKYRQQKFDSYLNVMQQSLDKLKKEQKKEEEKAKKYFN